APGAPRHLLSHHFTAHVVRYLIRRGTRCQLDSTPISQFILPKFFNRTLRSGPRVFRFRGPALEVRSPSSPFLRFTATSWQPCHVVKSRVGTETLRNFNCCSALNRNHVFIKIGFVFTIWHFCRFRSTTAAARGHAPHRSAIALVPPSL